MLYVAAEDAHGMRGRVKALRRRYGDAEGFKLIDGVSDLLSEASPDLAELRKLVHLWEPSLVIIDTLALAFPGLEENDAAAMGRVVAIGRSLTIGGAAVALVHHDTKAGTPTPRGHSLLNGALDAALQLLPSEQGVTKGRLSKNRNGTMDRLIAFSVATEELGVDGDGDTITAPVIQELSASALPAGERVKPSEQAILDRLHAMLADQPRLTENEFRQACVEDRKISASENRDSRRRIVTRAVTELVRHGLILIEGGFVMLPPDGFDTWEGV